MYEQQGMQMSAFIISHFYNLYPDLKVALDVVTDQIMLLCTSMILFNSLNSMFLLGILLPSIKCESRINVYVVVLVLFLFLSSFFSYKY